MCVILHDRCWVVYIPFVRMVKFKFPAHLLVDHLAHPVVSGLILLLCQFPAFTYYMIDGFVFITTYPTFPILLRLIYSRLGLVGSYGVVLCRY